jgi:hypothetical protein
MAPLGGPGCSTRPRVVESSSRRVAGVPRRRARALDVEQLLFETHWPAAVCAALALAAFALHAV